MAKHPLYLSSQKWAGRRRQAQRIAEQGGGWIDVAAAWGTGVATAHKACHERWPEIAMVISGSVSARQELPQKEVLRRLEILQEEYHNYDAAAERIGLTPAAIRYTVKKNAPNGVGVAINRLRASMVEAA